MFDCIVSIFLFQNINLKFFLVLSCLSWSPHRWVHTVMWDLPRGKVKSKGLSKTFQLTLTPSTSNTQQIQSLHIRLYQISSIWEDSAVNQTQGPPLNSSDMPTKYILPLCNRESNVYVPMWIKRYHISSNDLLQWKYHMIPITDLNMWIENMLNSHFVKTMATYGNS